MGCDMNNLETDMYSYSEESNKLSMPKPSIDKGKIKLIEINGETVSIVDPLVIAQMEMMIKTLQNRIALLEHEMRQTRGKLQRTDKRISETTRELQNKVSYE